MANVTLWITGGERKAHRRAFAISIDISNGYREAWGGPSFAARSIFCPGRQAFVIGTAFIDMRDDGTRQLPDIRVSGKRLAGIRKETGL